MGCSGNKAADADKPKSINGLPPAEDDDSPESNEHCQYEGYDWDGLINKIPHRKTEEDRNQRVEIWKNGLNAYGNGSVSYKKLSRDIRKYLDLPEEVVTKGPLKYAFDAAKNQYKTKWDSDDNYLQWNEFRIFLLFLKQYFEYWKMFETVDSSGDHKISPDEFKSAVPTMEKWGVKIADPDSEFNSIDANRNGVLTFDEFSNYAIKKSLQSEGDDDFDKEGIELLKKAN